MKDRGMIKWQPFQSVCSGSKMVLHILEKKNQCSKPILSEEQLRELENKLWEGYHNQMELCIVYFFQGKFQKKENILISKILVGQKKILFLDGSSLYFDQIIQVKEKNFLY